jgi:hypothetical protein
MGVYDPFGYRFEGIKRLYNSAGRKEADIQTAAARLLNVLQPFLEYGIPLRSGIMGRLKPPFDRFFGR